MASFSFSQTKIALTLGVLLGISALTAGVIGLNPNQATRTELGFQQPPPMSSLLEECGNFYWFSEDKLELTNSSIKEGSGVVVPVIPTEDNTEPLTEEAFRYYELSEIKTLPSVNELLATAKKYEGYIVWYMPSAKADAVENLVLGATELDENIMIVPWLGGHGGENRLTLPQNRDFAFTSFNNITQSCAQTQPFALKNFVDFANGRADKK